MKAALTWFHAAMYFSMQDVTQASSLLEREVPGFRMHFSKQFVWTFCGVVSLGGSSWSEVAGEGGLGTHLDQSTGIGKVGLLEDLLHDSPLDGFRVRRHCCGVRMR